ncbi:MAG: hypothetical protein E7638_06805 [Ruminococcaceae bacterium]|nr:hypothetical protein [Oscillospiraceae bacterium]
MKKRIIAALLLASMLTLTMSCTKNDEIETDETQQVVETEAGETSSETAAMETEIGETETEAPVQAESYNYMGNDLTPFITLGNYKGLAVTTASSVLTDEEYQEQLAQIMQSYSYNEKITDRAVAEGDTVVTSYSGYLDGVQFEGGTSASSEVVAADGQGMIDGFGPAFIGQMPGVEFSFNVTFPTVYGNLDLAGKEVTFVCTVDHIKGDKVITPELTDEFVRENTVLQTVEDFEIKLRENMALQKQQDIEMKMYDDLWAQVVEGSVVVAYPEGEVERNHDMMMSNMAAYAEMYGVGFDEFFAANAEYNNMTVEEYEDYNLLQAQLFVKENLVIYQIAKQEGIIIDDARFSERVASVAENNGVTEEEVINYYGRDTIMLSLLQEDVAKILTESAVITVAEGESETTAE